MPETTERRRTPRVAPQDEVRLSLSVALDMQVVDISSSGLLFVSDGELTLGQRVRIVTLLGGEPFSAWVDVRRAERESPLSPHARRCRYGARFATIEEKSRRTLQRFLGEAPAES